MEKWDLIAKYIAGEASEYEISQIKKWEEESIDNKIYLEKVRKVWKKAEPESNSFSPDVIVALEKVNTRIKIQQPKEVFLNPEKNASFYSNWRKLAAAILFLLGATFAFYIYNSNIEFFPQKLTLQETDERQRKTITLADGTKVWLNTRSALKFPQSFKQSTREVYLSGEGYFEVAKNAVKPFIIHLESQTQIEVLGTSFNINAKKPSKNVVVSVNSGKVKFGKANEEKKFILLEKETQGIYSVENQSFQKENEVDQNLMAWKTGKLSFQNVPLQSVFLTLSNHYQKDFVLGNTSLNNCKYNSSFDNLKLKEVTDIIGKSYGFEIAIEGNKIIFNGGKCL